MGILFCYLSVTINIIYWLIYKIRIIADSFYHPVINFIILLHRVTLSPIVGNAEQGGLMQGVGVAFLTILIPLAIAVLTGYLDKKARGERLAAISDLELSMILDKILHIKLLIVSSFLIFIPPLLWHKSSTEARYIVLLLWIIGNIILVHQIYRLYLWVKRSSSDYSFHRAYLNQIHNPSELTRVWKSVWIQQGLDTVDESQFLILFGNKIDTLVKEEKNAVTIQILLSDFLQTFDQRSLMSIFYAGDFFKKLLSWHYTLEVKQRQYLKGDTTETWIQYDLAVRTMNSFIRTTMEQTLIGRDYSSFSYFDMLEDHYQKCRSNKEYWKHFISNIAKTYFENISDSPESYDIWKNYFPAEWKITEDNLSNRTDNPAVIEWLKNYLDWARDKVNTHSEEFDGDLESVTPELFPDVEPVIFSAFIIFIVSPYGESRMKSLIEMRWNMGYSSRIFSSFNESTIEQDYKEHVRTQEESTINFINFFNTKILKAYTSDQLNKYITELTSLAKQYTDDPIKESRRQRILNLFRKLKYFSE